MWGSGWPVVGLRRECERWQAMAHKLTLGPDDAKRTGIFGGTATEFYRLNG